MNDFTPPAAPGPYGAPVCPDCGAALDGRQPVRCPECDLPLDGPNAVRLWQVDQGLQGLEQQRRTLLRLRGELIAELRSRRDAPEPAWERPRWQAPAAAEVSGPSAQAALLVLGGILLSVAALVFTVVSWGRLGITGRAVVLLAVTACALAAPLPLRRRALNATAEAFAAVGLALVLLDCYATRAAGLARLDSVDGLHYWAGATALAAVGAMAYGWTLRLRTPLVAGFLLGLLPGLLATWSAGEGPATLAMVATAAVYYVLLRAVADREEWRDRHHLDDALPVAAAITAVWGLAAGTVALSTSMKAALGADPSGAPIPPTQGRLATIAWAWPTLGGLALLALAVALPHPRLGYPGVEAAGRRVAAGAAGAALLMASGATLAYLLPTGWAAVGYALPAALLAVAMGAVLRGGRGASVLPVGVLAVSGAVLLLSSAVPVFELIPALAQPLSHLRPAWADGLAPGWAWPVPTAGLTLLWLLLACATAVRALGAGAARGAVVAGAAVGEDAAPDVMGSDAAAGGAVERDAAALVNPSADGALAQAAVVDGAAGGVAAPANPSAGAALAVAAVAAIALLPVALGLPYLVAMGTVALLAIAAAVHAALRPPRAAVTAALVAASALALAWSLADRPATIAVLAVGVVAAVALTGRGPAPAVAAGSAVTALGAEAVAVGATAGLALPDIMLAVLAVAVATAPVAARAKGRTDGAAPSVSLAVECTGYGLAAFALLLTVGHPARLSFDLTVAGTAALGIALRADRRRPAWAAALVLLIVASWIRLALWSVHTPEAYSLTVAAAALLLGRMHRRRSPATDSWAAYGPGLGVGFVPSLLAVWADPHWIRPLLLGGAALVVTVLGVRSRLQCPLLLGGGTLLLVGGHELAPTVVQALGLLPRWVPLAAAGLLLLALGATYEQRLRDARRLRSAFRRLG